MGRDKGMAENGGLNVLDAADATTPPRAGGRPQSSNPGVPKGILRNLFCVYPCSCYRGGEE